MTEQQTRGSRLSIIYDRIVLGHPLLSIAFCCLITAWLSTYIPTMKLDASADSLVLEGDTALEYFRETGARYSSDEFLLVAYQPNGDLLSDEVLDNLRVLRNELTELEGVSSVVSILDVPLLNSPRIDLSEITSSGGVPTLETPGIDRELVRAELRDSPIYRNLLTSPSGETTALQVNLQRDDLYLELLKNREALRTLSREGALEPAEAKALQEAELSFKNHTGEASQRQTVLVANARAVIERHRHGGTLFLGGVPMIAADMLSFVRSDLVVFGGGIVLFVVVMLAIIFRQPRWVLLPLMTCVVTATFMLGLLTWLDWRMTVISSNFIALLLIITLAITIHLVVRYRELQLISPEASQRQLVGETVSLMVKPCLYTSMTTIVAFVSLVVSGIRPVIDFGWMMTVGIISAFVFTFVLFPSVLALLPKSKAATNVRDDKGLTLVFARATERHGGAVLVFSAALLVLTLFGVSRLEVENRFIDYFHESTEIYRGMELIDKELGGTISLDIIIDLDTEVLAWEEDFAKNDVATSAASGDQDEDDYFDEEGDGFSDGFGDDFSDGFSDDFGGNGSSDGEEAYQQSYWLSLSGIRKIEAIHDYIDSLPETGKVLSLGTLYKVVKGLLGDDAGNVELALVDKSLPDSIKSIMIDPYLSRDIEQARISLRVKETSKTLRRNDFLTDLREHLTTSMGLEPEQVHFTGMLVLYNNMLQSLYR
ncbi:MAG: putative RND superfamily exporter protein, partial [Halieaceae bacterium]